MPIAIAFLNEKDHAIMKAMVPLRSLEAKMDPLMDIHDLLKSAIEILVFGDKKEDATYEIKLDDNHSMIFEMKDGKFGIDQTCTCDHEEENEDVRLSPKSGGLAELLVKAMMER